MSRRVLPKSQIDWEEEFRVGMNIIRNQKAYPDDEFHAPLHRWINHPKLPLSVRRQLGILQRKLEKTELFRADKIDRSFVLRIIATAVTMRIQNFRYPSIFPKSFIRDFDPIVNFLQRVIEFDREGIFQRIEELVVWSQTRPAKQVLYGWRSSDLKYEESAEALHALAVWAEEIKQELSSSSLQQRIPEPIPGDDRDSHVNGVLVLLIVLLEDTKTSVSERRWLISTVTKAKVFPDCPHIGSKNMSRRMAAQYSLHPRVLDRNKMKILPTWGFYERNGERIKLKGRPKGIPLIAFLGWEKMASLPPPPGIENDKKHRLTIIVNPGLQKANDNTGGIKPQKDYTEAAKPEFMHNPKAPKVEG